MPFSVMILIVAVMILSMGRRRRYWGDWRRMPPYDPRGGGPPVGNRRPEWSGTRDDVQEHIDALESRIVQLEERLDFTERLLQERSAAGMLSPGRPASQEGKPPESTV